MIPSTLGERLTEYRKRKRWTLEDLEEFSGVSRNQIGRIERGVTNPTRSTLLKIEKALDLPYGTLYAQLGPADDEEDIVRTIEAKLINSHMNKDQLTQICIIIESIINISEG